MSVIDRMVDTIADEQGITKTQAREGVLLMLELIEEELLLKGECAIPKFGKFALTEREARTGRNPLNGKTIQIAATTGIRFKPASTLKARFNAKPQPAPLTSPAPDRLVPRAQRRAAE